MNLKEYIEIHFNSNDSKNTDKCINSSKDIILLIKKSVFNKEDSSNYKYKKVISALLYLTQNIFDKDSCTLGEIEKFLEEKNDKTTKKRKTIEEEFLKFCRNFYAGIKFESKLYENITLSSKLSVKKSKFIDLLISKDFLEREAHLQKRYYKINSEYHRSVKNFIGNDTIDRKLMEIIKSFI